MAEPSNPDSHADSAADDSSLIARLAAGDVAAFEEAIRRYWSGIARFAVRTLGDRETANDVAQETFIRLWQTRGDLRHTLLRAYLFRVARNLALDELRKRSVRSRFADEQRTVGDAAATADSELVDRELHDDIERAIGALTARRREAFTLAYLHQLSYKEVAEIMGTSTATVRNQISAALGDLRRALAQYRAPDSRAE